MKKVISVFAILFFFVGNAVAEQPASQAAKNEYQNHCALGVALGKSVPCNASQSADTTWKDSTTGKDYCFSSAEMKQEFAKDAAGNVKKADQNWPSVQASKKEPNQG